MIDFWKRPKFWGALILILWLAYVLWANVQIIFPIYLVPFLIVPHTTLPAIIVASAILGSVLTLVIEFYWRRWRSSKNAAASAAASATSNRTVA